MKDKKLVIVLVLIIVLLLIGGAYLLGKSNNKWVNIEENNEQQVNNDVSDCLPTTAPWVKVISPNGGEIYTIGQQINVKWKSCNLSNSMHLRASLERQAPLPNHEWQIPILFGDVSEGQVPSSLNDGEQSVVLDSAHSVVPASYKLCISEYVTPSGQDIIQDCSDNSFTIKNQDKTIVGQVIGQQEAENLVKKTWGDCSGEGCSGFKVTVVSPNSKVVAIYPQLDDSVAFIKKEAFAVYQNGEWTLGVPTITKACHLNRGHQDFSTAPCN